MSRPHSLKKKYHRNNQMRYNLINAYYLCGEEITTSELVIEKCEIPNVITPNGDGENDFFYTHFAAIYDDVNFTVFNRWGKIVYESTNYKNDWNGTNLNGSPLSEGSYFFFISFDNGKEKNQGIVQIINSN